MAPPIAEVAEIVRRGDSREVHRILVEDPEIAKKKDDSGRTLVHWGDSGGNRELLEYILSLNRDFDATDDVEWTPLMIASSAGHLEVVRYLISLGADVNATNSTGQSALHYAASKDHPKIVGLLLENDCNINVQDRYRHTALHRAASKGNKQCLDTLLRNTKIQVNLQDTEGNTALHLACEEDRETEAIMLVKRGASLQVENESKKTAFDIASPGLKKSLKRAEETR